MFPSTFQDKMKQEVRCFTDWIAILCGLFYSKVPPNHRRPVHTEETYRSLPSCQIVDVACSSHINPPIPLHHGGSAVRHVPLSQNNDGEARAWTWHKVMVMQLRRSWVCHHAYLLRRSWVYSAISTQVDGDVATKLVRFSNILNSDLNN